MTRTGDSSRSDRECARVQRRVTAFVDGRLDARERAATQQHLRGCARCMQEARDLTRLARATHNLPPHRAESGLADRVRRGLADRRSRGLADLDTRASARHGRSWQRVFRAPGLRAAAAGIAIALVWGAGFVAGRSVEWLTGATGESAGPAGVTTSGIEQRRVTETVPAILVDPEFVTTGREVLADLAWAECLPPSARRPMLASQFALFELRERAEAVLERAPTTDPTRSLAQLVHDFGTTLAGPGAIDWRAWSSAARAVQLALPTRSHIAARPIVGPPGIEARPRRALEPTITHALANCGAELSQHERRDLAELLRFKQQLVHDTMTGGPTAAASRTTTFLSHWQSSTTSGGGHDGTHITTSFRLATGVRAARTLHDAGHGNAPELARLIERMARDLGLDPAVDLPLGQ